MNKKFLLTIFIFTAVILSGNLIKSVLAAGAGFYVQPTTSGDVYDINGGQFRHVSYDEAVRDNIWSQIKKFDPNTVPLYDRAGDGKITAVLFSREPWVQDAATFNAIFGSAAWSRIIKPAAVPTVSISASPTSITVGQSTTISWSSTNATGCTGSLGSAYPTSGSFSDNPSSTKTYGMKCTGAGGTSAMQYVTVTVNAAANQSPTAGITMTSGGTTAYENQTLNVSGSPASVSFSGSRSSDPDGSISSYVWKINGTQVSTASSFTYSLAAGTHSISLMVTDNKGATGSVGGTVIVTAVSGFYVRATGKSEVYDISSGQFRTVSYDEAVKNNIWSQVKDFDPSAVPLVRKAGEYEVDVTIFGKTAWIQNQDVFNKIGFDWNKVTTNLKGSYKPTPPNKTVGDAISLWWETLNLVNPATITCKNVTLNTDCVGWKNPTSLPNSGNGTNNNSSAITYTPTVGGKYVFNISSNPSASVEVMVIGFQCSDGIDNDGDGIIDMLDPGCSGPLDNDETDGGPIIPLPQCSDGVDNDGDLKVDMADPGCSSPADNDETDGVLPPTLFVTLSANPLSGNAPLASTLTANVSGTASGPITYQFDCGNGSPLGSFANVGDNPKTFSCTYAAAGNYTALVRVDRGGAPQTQASINVSASAVPPAIIVFNPIAPLVPVINVFEPFIGVVVPPVCTITANPIRVIQPKNTTTLSWSCDQVVNGCTITDDNPKMPDLGGVSSTGSSVTPALTATTTFTFKCPKAADSSVKVGFFNPYFIEINPKPL